MEYSVRILDTDYSRYVALPISLQTTLDESLNIGSVVLNGLDRAEPFKPFTKCVVSSAYNIGGVYDIANDEVTKVLSTNKYNHTLSLIEQSKELERITGITKTNTIPLVKDLADTVRYCFISEKRPNGSVSIIGTTEKLGTPYNVQSPLLQTTFTAPSMTKLHDLLTLGDYQVDRGAVYHNNIKIQDLYIADDINIDVSSMEGNWQVKFEATDPQGGIGSRNKYEYSFVVMKEIPSQDIKYTITTVINDLLATCECLRYRAQPRYILDEEQAIELDKIPAPEFALNGTLWECLSEIGGYIHAIPELYGGVITFKQLGKSGIANTLRPNIKSRIDSNTISSIEKVNIEQFTTVLDSLVDNIVNTDDKQSGTLIAPFDGGYKTVRTDTGIVEIRDDNVLIETREPIEEVISLQCGKISNGAEVGDITPYLFESAEYDALSKFDLGYPLSRNFALKYTQGQRNITGLNYKSPNAISPVFTEYSIKNIIARKLNIPVSSIASEDIKNLQFKVKYVPIISARVQQVKSCIEDYTTKSMLDFNQGANKINSKAYGENMKGVIARLGNPEKVIIYYTKKPSVDIPDVGILYDDDYYISVVKTEWYSEFMKVELVLSKNFNKLNEYVGIKSQKRFYEISEKQALNRYINYSDMCVIGDKAYKGYDSSVLTQEALSTLANSFKKGAVPQNSDVDVVKVQGFSNIQDNLPQVALPVNSLAMGNALVFSFHFDDNYSAGNTREEQNGAKLQYQLKYTDIYGRVDHMYMALGKSTNQNGSYDQNVAWGNSLPYADNVTMRDLFVADIDIRKDNRENIAFTYQLNFVTQDNTYVLGSALAQKNCFITNEPTQYKLCVYKDKIGKFANKLPNGRVVLDGLENVVVNPNDFTITFPEFTCPSTSVSWAIVTQDDELVIGRNQKMQENEQIKSTVLSFLHNII